MKLPPQLEALPQSFAHRDFRAEGVGQYRIASWQKYFANDEDFNSVVRQYPAQVARAAFATVGSEQRTTSDLRQLFFTTMLWEIW